MSPARRHAILITGPSPPRTEVLTCGSLHFALGIRPPGVVEVCSKLAGERHFDLGDLRCQSLREIWFGERAEALRRRVVDPARVSEPCAPCPDLENCMTGCFFDSWVAHRDPYTAPPSCRRFGALLPQQP